MWACLKYRATRLFSVNFTIGSIKKNKKTFKAELSFNINGHNAFLLLFAVGKNLFRAKHMSHKCARVHVSATSVFILRSCSSWFSFQKLKQTLTGWGANSSKVQTSALQGVELFVESTQAFSISLIGFIQVSVRKCHSTDNWLNCLTSSPHSNKS